MKKSGTGAGVDVPWVTSWTAEPVIGLRPCSTVQARPALVQVDNPGYGRSLNTPGTISCGRDAAGGAGRGHGAPAPTAAPRRTVVRVVRAVRAAARTAPQAGKKTPHVVGDIDRGVACGAIA